MEYSLQLVNESWEEVFFLEKGTDLTKNRTKTNHQLREKAAFVKDRFVCYRWTSHTDVFYCGSVSNDYRGHKYQSNLEGRLHNYLQTHQQRPNGRKNTNLMVFENVCSQLQIKSVVFSVLRFDRLILSGKAIPFEDYSQNPDLVHAVEQLLIATYKSIGQCGWNRSTRTNFGRVKSVPATSVPKSDIGTTKRIREFILKEKINPGRENGTKTITLRSGEIHREMGLIKCMPSVCGAIDRGAFQESTGIKLVSRTGPKNSSTVEWVFEI
ncbi:MAG: hypothetical protein AB9897_04330 [Anaerolineaceae bacterium]